MFKVRGHTPLPILEYKLDIKNVSEQKCLFCANLHFPHTFRCLRWPHEGAIGIKRGHFRFIYIFWNMIDTDHQRVSKDAKRRNKEDFLDPQKVEIHIEPFKPLDILHIYFLTCSQRLCKISKDSNGFYFF
jgi:hypothetical protein